MPKVKESDGASAGEIASNKGAKTSNTRSSESSAPGRPKADLDKDKTRSKEATGSLLAGLEKHFAINNEKHGQLISLGEDLNEIRKSIQKAYKDPTPPNIITAARTTYSIGMGIAGGYAAEGVLAALKAPANAVGVAGILAGEGSKKIAERQFDRNIVLVIGLMGIMQATYLPKSGSKSGTNPSMELERAARRKLD
jgi:hypothetical protein